MQKLGRKPRSRALRTVPLYGSSQSSVGVHADSPEGAQSSADRSEGSLASPPDALTAQRQTAEELARLFEDSPDFDAAERELLAVCLGNVEAVGQFTLGPSFHGRHQWDLVRRLRSAVPQLKDGFLSGALIMARHQNLPVSQTVIDICAQRAVVGVATLRMVQVKRREDVTICLVLGITTATYSLFVANGEIQAICACVLSSIRPWYRSSNVLLEVDEYAYLICLMYTEMIECIIKSETPTLKYGEFNKYITWVDRYLGLAPPLLGFLYDICEMSSSLRISRNVDAAAHRRLVEIEWNIRRWKPMKPVDFPDRFTHVEVMQVMTQIKSLRQGALLLIHRLQYPYGTHDEKGLALSDSILLECSLALQHISRVPMGMDIAFVIASFEPREAWHQEETLVTVAETLKFSSGFQERVRVMLQLVWTAKTRRSDMYWFDLAELTDLPYQPPFDVR